MTSTELVEDVETNTSEDLEEGKLSHIVWGDELESGGAKVMTAMVNGTPVTALCGYTWVPSRDPQKYPVCEECLEALDFIKKCR